MKNTNVETGGNPLFDPEHVLFENRFYLVDWGAFMGHIRLGSVPKTRKWIEVVALIASSDDERLFEPGFRKSAHARAK